MGAEGVVWTKTSSVSLTRYHGSAGGNTVYSPATQAVATTYFDALAPWAYMGRVSLRPDGTIASRCNIGTNVAAQHGDTCYNDTSDAGGEQKMVFISTFCAYCDTSFSGAVVWWIGQVGDSFVLEGASGNFSGSSHTFNTSDIHPAFIVDGVAKPGIYVSAYEGYVNTNFLGAGTTVLESLAGVTPTGSTTKANFRTYAETLGTGWELMTIQAMGAIQYLFIVEYATIDSQSYGSASGLGMGLTNVANPSNTGLSTLYGNESYGTHYDYTTVVTYRGIENLWGNMSKFIEGIRTDATPTIYIAPQTVKHTYVDTGTTPASPYVSTSSTLPVASSLNITNVFATSALGWYFIPSTASGASYGSYFSDALSSAAAAQIVAVGGNCTSWTAAGIFTLFCYSYTQTSWLTGARIQYLPS